jgi:hypothetical protein
MCAGYPTPRPAGGSRRSSRLSSAPAAGLTIHRTWLERQCNGRVLKAPVAEPKKVCLSCKSGTIRLARGVSARPWAEAPIGDVISAKPFLAGTYRARTFFMHEVRRDGLEL